MQSTALRKVSFTGSTHIGKLLLEQAAGQVLRTSMELGGNAPFIVFDDADIEAAVAGAVVAKTRNAGQSCVAANRFLVHHTIAREFADLLAQRLQAMPTGAWWEDDVVLGPLIDSAGRAKVHRLVDAARASGSEVLCGGHVLKRPGFFYEPTVLFNVPPGSPALAEEIFGPVAPVTTFGSEDEAIRLANQTEHGLVAYLYTTDINRTQRVQRALEVGMLGINRGLVSDPAAPFGGVKSSGLGREGGAEGIAEYLETKYLAIQAPPPG